jgi:ADP-ribosylglycohydrolase
MLGAIIGDILGSIHEIIPGKPVRKEIQMTDDSFLTLACLEWMNKIDIVKFKFLYDKNKVLENRDFSKFVIELNKNAEKKLIKWHDIGSNQEKEDLIPGFSKGFSTWCEEKKHNKKVLNNKRYTNGCLMRNSPISYIGYKNGLTLEQVVFLSELFCKTTHYSEEAIKATKVHSTILYYILNGIINKNNIKESIEDLNVNIQTLENWLPTEERVLKNKNHKFIWHAKESLDIALSSIYYSNSFEETLNFCNSTKMDTDTYSAIAGPIAEYLWGMPGELKYKLLPILEKNHEVKSLLEKNELI